jgi:capsule biosynthesis phosphatase
MTHQVNCIVLDIDGTICKDEDAQIPYIDREPYLLMVEKIQRLHKAGIKIVLFTSRNMNTYKGNVGLIQANTMPVLLEWLKKHEIPFDELYCGKPWPGEKGFYVDDKAYRPEEFLEFKNEEIIDRFN